MIDYFWDQVAVGEPDACWMWLGKVNRGGYGYLNPGGVGQVRAHRYAYFLTHGEWPVPQCLHLPLSGQGPHDRRCCNPLHLYAGTNRQNVADRLPLVGQRNGRYKVDPARVLATEGTANAVARLYGISPGRVRQIRTGH